MAAGNGLKKEKWPAFSIIRKVTFDLSGTPSSTISAFQAGVIWSCSAVSKSMGIVTFSKACINHPVPGASKTIAFIRGSDEISILNPSFVRGTPPANANAVYPPIECPITAMFSSVYICQMCFRKVVDQWLKLHAAACLSGFPLYFLSDCRCGYFHNALT